MKKYIWKWFSTRHLKKFKNIIDEDTILKKIVDEDLDITEESIKAFLLADTNELTKIKKKIDDYARRH